VQAYIERDVRSVGVIQDLPKFRRLLALLATRHGQWLNHSELAAPIGASVPNISHWIDVLEASGLILVVPPYYNNFGKRLLKTPKNFLDRLRFTVPPSRHWLRPTPRSLPISRPRVRGPCCSRNYQSSDQRRTPLTAMAQPMLTLLEQWQKQGAPAPAPAIEAWLVHRRPARELISKTLSPGVRICTPADLFAIFGRR
jgi:DNA-binding transcriptional ArsR family regulator